MLSSVLRGTWGQNKTLDQHRPGDARLRGASLEAAAGAYGAKCPAPLIDSRSFPFLRGWRQIRVLGMALAHL